MNPRNRLEAVLPERLSAIARDLPSAVHGDVEAVHRTRVASRRVREALPIIEDQPGDLKKARRRTRALTRALGAVRELDVALELLAGHPTTSPEGRAALEFLRAEIVEERERRRQVMLDELAAIKPDKIIRCLSDAVQALPTGAEARWPGSLSQRLARRVEWLRTTIEHAGSLYLPDRLHQVRIAAKKLRYALEITGDLRLAPTASAVRTLKSVQDTLGHLHDLEVLNAHVRRVGQVAPIGREGLGAELEALTHEIEDQCRAEHAKFLAARGRLLRVADVAMSVSARLAATRPPRVARVGAGRRARPSRGVADA